MNEVWLTNELYLYSADGEEIVDREGYFFAGE